MTYSKRCITVDEIEIEAKVKYQLIGPRPVIVFP